MISSDTMRQNNKLETNRKASRKKETGNCCRLHWTEKLLFRRQNKKSFRKGDRKLLSCRNTTSKKARTKERKKS